MSVSLQHVTDVTTRRGRVRRRDFLRAIAVAGTVGGVGWKDALTLQAEELRRRGMSCILLWMQGGPSQYETFDPKAGHKNGGETNSIKTSVPGIEIAENLPHVAKQMNDICLVRSMNSKEGSHPRASYLMHTGYLPTASVKYPSIGANVAHQIGDPESDLPSFVRIGRNRGDGGGGLLGVDYNPFVMQRAGRMPDDTEIPSDETRYRRRLKLLGRLESEFENSGGKQAVIDHRKVYGKAARMVTSSKMKAFDLEQEPSKARAAYGESDFASGCLLARRLVESGVTFVEVSHGNWDTHFDNFSRTKELCGQMDQPYAALLADLKQRGMLDKTLVVWMGEFGRTPRINARNGRDHYPRAYSMALSGAGIKGGQVIGATDSGGASVADRPVGVSDLFRTVYDRLKINGDHENMSSVGRPIKLVDGGEVIKEAT